MKQISLINFCPKINKFQTSVGRHLFSEEREISSISGFEPLFPPTPEPDSTETPLRFTHPGGGNPDGIRVSTSGFSADMPDVPATIIPF
jgi:hypothetical protein